jgi:hypothetical protein
MSMDDANTMIMAARAHWFDDEDGEGAQSADADGETSAEE